MQAVLVYEPDIQALAINKSEIFRYLGHKQGMEISTEVTAMVDEVLHKILQNSVPKVCYKRFRLEISEEIEFGFVSIKSKELMQNLEGCKEAVVFAATIGIFTDRQIQKETILSPVKACIYQAVGAAVIEAVCDDFNKWLLKEETKKGFGLKPRFSPGYGDVPLWVQKDICRELNAAKNAGITLTDSMLMIPEKSVTAIVGIKKKN